MKARSHPSGEPFSRDRLAPSPSRRVRGTILLGTIIILLTISFIGATLASFFLSVTAVSQTELERLQALYLAEAGIAQAVYQLQQAGRTGGQAPQQLPPIRLGEGRFEISHDLTSGHITSTGEVRGVRRTIQIQYQPF